MNRFCSHCWQRPGNGGVDPDGVFYCSWEHAEAGPTTPERTPEVERYIRALYEGFNPQYVNAVVERAFGTTVPTSTVLPE